MWRRHIYEGDIVRFFTFEASYWDGQVVWESCSWRLKGKNLGELVGLCDELAYKFEKRWATFSENPELLQ